MTRRCRRAVSTWRGTLARRAPKPLLRRGVPPGRRAKHRAAPFDHACPMAKTRHHPVGTCRMRTDAIVGVRPQLRLQGVRGLRACDASDKPRTRSSDTGAPTIMIGEPAGTRGRHQPQTGSTSDGSRASGASFAMRSGCGRMEPEKGPDDVTAPRADRQAQAAARITPGSVRELRPSPWLGCRDVALRDASPVDPVRQAAGGRIVAELEGGADGVFVVDVAP
jgi:hypothetical protein